MKQILLLMFSTLLAILLMACGSVYETTSQSKASSSVPTPSISQESEISSKEVTNHQTDDMLVQLTTDKGETITFAINDSNAAKSFYQQLPLSLEIEDYSNNEKIFYLPKKLDTNNTPMAEGPKGTIAYYEPWGNVAIYYGDCGGAVGLYELGNVISGVEYISKMTGQIRIEVAAALPPTTESVKSESTSTSQTSKETVTSAQLPKESNTSTQPPSSEISENTVDEEVENVKNIQLTIGTKSFTVTLDDNKAAVAFVEMIKNAPVSINMSDHGGFEKVGSLGTSLPTSNSSITATEGDIILYNGNQIVVFYGSNSWSYTKLGKIDDLSGWKEALGDGDVTITFSIK